jgi:hypothetical protein
MTPAVPGPEVDAKEDLYRCLMHQGWYNEEEDRVSSAAFSWATFSVDVASIAGSQEATLSRFLPGTGLVVFNCGEAKGKGCVTRLEPDDRAPDNKAHAHVYMPGKSGDRKRAVQHLIKVCKVLKKPQLAEAS